MGSRRGLSRLYYFTVEDEGILAEAFPRLEEETFCVTYKVAGTEDVFVTTADTKDVMDRNDVAYNLLAEEEGLRVSLLHNPQSREELSDYDIIDMDRPPKAEEYAASLYQLRQRRGVPSALRKVV